MWSLIAAAGGIGSVLALAVWALKAYTAMKKAEADAVQRQAGRDAQQNEATNAEINRVQNAARAGAVADGVRDNKPDPNDRDGQ
jgi:uncharacterized membrane protein YebE (DUF533 family)